MTNFGPVGREGRPWGATHGRGVGASGQFSAGTVGATGLAEECEAYLCGSFAELQGSRRKPVEAWAWVNRVAHAEPGQLRALASGASAWWRPGVGRGRFRERYWRRAVSDIARELLNLAGENPKAVRRLQVRALIPLELELARRDSPYPVTPELLVGKARAALYRSLSRSSAGVLEDCTGYFNGGGPGPAGARRHGRTGDAIVAVFSVSVVGVLVALGGANRAPSRPSSLYGYYSSRLSSTGDRALQGEEAFAWMTGGKSAPGWERGRDLPAFLLPWQGEGPGAFVGWLFAGAPGRLARGIAALKAGTSVPAGAVIDVGSNTISFSGSSASLKVAALEGGHFRIAGLISPTVVVRSGAAVRIELVNDDATSAHGLAIVARGSSSSSMPMASAKPVFPGAAVWYLGDATGEGAHEGVLTFTAGGTGVYQYVDPVPGDARDGMAGALEVTQTGTAR